VIWRGLTERQRRLLLMGRLLGVDGSWGKRRGCPAPQRREAAWLQPVIGCTRQPITGFSMTAESYPPAHDADIPRAPRGQETRSMRCVWWVPDRHRRSKPAKNGHVAGGIGPVPSANQAISNRFGLGGQRSSRAPN